MLGREHRKLNKSPFGFGIPSYQEIPSEMQTPTFLYPQKMGQESRRSIKQFQVNEWINALSFFHHFKYEMRRQPLSKVTTVPKVTEQAGARAGSGAEPADAHSSAVCTTPDATHFLLRSSYNRNAFLCLYFFRERHYLHLK